MPFTVYIVFKDKNYTTQYQSYDHTTRSAAKKQAKFLKANLLFISLCICRQDGETISKY